GFEIFFAQHLDGAICRPLWRRSVIVVFFINAIIILSATLTLAQFVFQVSALLFVGVQMFRQAFAFRRGQAHLTVIALGGSRGILGLFVPQVTHVPVIHEHLVKDCFLFMTSK